jgi:hypothetical protein
MPVNLSELEMSFQHFVEDEHDSRPTMLKGYLAENPARIAGFATAEDLAPVLGIGVSADVHAAIRKRFADLKDEDPEATDAVAALLAQHAPEFAVSSRIAGLEAWFEGLRDADEDLVRRIGVCLAYLKTRASYRPRLHPHNGM